MVLIITLLCIWLKSSYETAMICALRNRCDQSHEDYHFTFGVYKGEDGIKKSLILKKTTDSAVSLSRLFDDPNSDNCIVAEISQNHEVLMEDDTLTQYQPLDRYTLPRINRPKRVKSLFTIIHFHCAKILIQECYEFTPEPYLFPSDSNCGLRRYLSTYEILGMIIFVLKDQKAGSVTNFKVSYEWILEKFQYNSASDQPTNFMLYSNVLSYKKFSVDFNGHKIDVSLPLAYKNRDMLLHEDEKIKVVHRRFQSFSKQSTEIWKIWLIYQNMIDHCTSNLLNLQFNLVPSDGEAGYYFTTTTPAVEACHFDHLWKQEIEILSEVQNFRVSASVSLLEKFSKPNSVSKIVFPNIFVNDNKIKTPISFSNGIHKIYFFPYSDSDESSTIEVDFTLVVFITFQNKKPIIYCHLSPKRRSCSREEMTLLGDRFYVHIKKSSSDFYMLSYKSTSWHILFSEDDYPYIHLLPKSPDRWAAVSRFVAGKLDEKAVSALSVPNMQQYLA